MIEGNKKNKLLISANEILIHIGGVDNFDKIYNCITRVRFKIKDREKVKVEVLKKINIVKGVVWSGNELQVIIGANVDKVKMALDSIIINSSSTSQTKLIRTPIYKKLLNFIIAVVVPCLPMMFYTGLSSGISALLSSPGIQLTESGWGKSLGDLDLISAFLFLNERVGFMLLGVFFGVNTSRYLNGDLMLSLLICLTLSSGLLMGQNWILVENIFNTGQNLAIKGYDGSILIFVFSNIGFVYLHKWVKTWMPSVLSSMFTPIVSVGIILSTAFFLVGPIISLLELLIATGVLFLLDIPFGIGAFLVALLFQPLVLTGSHMALSSIVLSAMTNPEVGQPSVYYVCVQISAFGQAGAVLGCALMAKEKNFKASAFSTFPITSFFGITEPALYAVNLPKLKPFLAGCAASGFLGLTAGVMGLKMKSYTGNGVFGFLGFENLLDGAIFLSLGLITILIACIFTCLIYSERQNEYKVFKNFTSKLNKLIGEEKINDLKLNFKNVEEFSKDNKIIELEIIKLQTLKNKLDRNKVKKLPNNKFLNMKYIELEVMLKERILNYNKKLDVLISLISLNLENNNEAIGIKKDYIKKNIINGISSLKNNYISYF